MKIETEKGPFTGAVEEPFESEREIEDYLAANPESIGLRRILARQRGMEAGTPDLIGVDFGDNLVVVEVKGGVAGYGAVAQAACYTNWFETASEKALKRYFKGGRGRRSGRKAVAFPRHAGMRAIVVAPRISGNAIRVANGLSYPVEFYTIRRWRREGPGVVTAVLTFPYSPDERMPQLDARVGRKSDERAVAEWTAPKYFKRYGEEAVKEFLARTEELEAFSEERKLKTTKALRSQYSSFKRLTPGGGTARVFGVRFISRLTIVYYFVLPCDEAARLAPEPMRNYYENQREAWFTIRPGRTRLSDLAALLEAAYERAGRRGVNRAAKLLQVRGG